ncbi:MAG: cytochrome c-type biogenesis protein CcmH [Deltaproteobacteria bacterium]|nr:MAG: cytochrome c-type biogenesis protein CcmH [Deltaproteobacteria bacterium]
MDLDRRHRHGPRHDGRDVADSCRAARACVCPRPGPGGDGLSVGAAALLAVTLLLAASPAAHATTQQEVEEALTCQCGCGLTVHACNHLQCGSGEPMKKEINERLAAGETEQTILEAFRARYGEKVLSSPTFHGFNWLAWITPFAAVLAGALVLALTIRRWGAQATRPAPVVPPPADADGGLRARLARELAEFDAE